MRTVWQATAFLLVVIFVSLIYKLPAKFVYRQFETNSQLQLHEISGSIWSGHAEQIQLPQITLERLDWQLSPFALLFGEAAIKWTLNDPDITLLGELTLSSDIISLADIHGNIDVLAIMQRLPQPALLLGGIIELNIDEIKLGPQSIIAAAGTLDWQQAGLLAPESIAFGSFNANLASQTERLILQFSDTDGAVSLSGEAALTRFGAFQYTMKLGIHDTSVPGLLEGFNQLGQADSDGTITMRASGNLM